MATALAFRWDGRRARLAFQTRPGSYDAASLRGFLQLLRQHFQGTRLILIWDRLPAHRSRELAAYFARERPWVTVEWLPGYAPELNPVEYVWGNLDGQELANRCAPDLAAVGRAVRVGMARVRRQPHLLFAFLKHAGLSF